MNTEMNSETNNRLYVVREWLFGANRQGWRWSVKWTIINVVVAGSIAAGVLLVPAATPTTLGQTIPATSTTQLNLSCPTEAPIKTQPGVDKKAMEAMAAAIGESHFNKARIAYEVGNQTSMVESFCRAVKYAYLSNDWDLNNDICWEGSIDRVVLIVFKACERAVTLSEHQDFHYGVLDSRGLALALRGYLPEAIEDFSVYAKNTHKPKQAAQRLLWIEKLRKAIELGQNADGIFDADTLESLRYQTG